MNLILKMIFALVCGVCLGVFVLFLIDYAVAQRESESGQKAVDCIFEQNCAYFNNQRTDFFKG